MLPILLIGGAIGLAWLLSGGGGVVTRSPAPVPGRGNRPGAGGGARPVMPAAPGADHAVTEAMRDAEAIARTPAPSPPPSHDEEPAPSPAPAPTPTPSRPSHDEPPRPTPPSRTGDAAFHHVPTHEEQQHAVSASADHDHVSAAAHRVLESLRTGGSYSGEPVTTRQAAISDFQRSYGQGLTVDGTYGRGTRNAMALILGVSRSSLPSLTHHA